MTKLTQLAADMRHIVDTTGATYCHHKLSRGLELVLQRTGRGYRLALGRTDTAPSDTEIELCMDAFNVPAGAEPNRTTKTRPGKTGTLTYHVAELTGPNRSNPMRYLEHLEEPVDGHSGLVARQLGLI